MNWSENNENCSTCELEENIRMLRGIYFFSAVSLELLKLLAYLCQRESYMTGDVLFHQGDDDGQSFYVITGRGLLVRTDEGREKELRPLKTGEFIGGLSLTAHLPRLFTLRAETEMLCLVLSREKFQKAIAQFPDAMPRIWKALAGRISDWEARFLKSCADICKHQPEVIGISLV